MWTQFPRVGYFGVTCLVELEELLFDALSLGLLAMSPEPLHSLPVYQRGACRPTHPLCVARERKRRPVFKDPQHILRCGLFIL